MYTPYVVDPKTTETGRVVDIWSRLNNDRIIFIGEEITAHTANRVVAQLLCAEIADPLNDVHLYINSPGGSVYAGLAILDVMNYIKPDVSTVCFGYAASMAAVLLSAGAKGKRVILPNARVMIHQPLGGTYGQATDMEIATKQILLLKKKLTKIFADNCNITLKKAERDLERDYWLCADEAVTYGIVDKIISSRMEIYNEENEMD